MEIFEIFGKFKYLRNSKQISRYRENPFGKYTTDNFKPRIKLELKFNEKRNLSHFSSLFGCVLFTVDYFFFYFPNPTS